MTSTKRSRSEMRYTTRHSPTRIRHKSLAPSSFTTPDGRGFAVSASICLRMRRATWGSRSWSSLRADRAKTTAKSATRPAFGANLDKALYGCERLTAFTASSVSEIGVVEILPQPLVLPEVDKHGLSPAFSVTQKLPCNVVLCGGPARSS